MTTVGMRLKPGTFEELKGLVLKSVVVRMGGTKEEDEVVFELEDGRKFKLYHEQDCCESVTINDIEGMIDENHLVDLEGSEVLFAEESSNEPPDGEYGESSTWTFYRIGTIKGSVVIRWLGSSNGYYSESVDFRYWVEEA